MLVRVIALGFLFMVLGAASAHYRFFPGNIFGDAFKSLDWLIAYEALRTSDERGGLIYEALYPGAGVTVNKEGAFQGYTTIASTDEQSVELIDMEGNVVHTWTLDFRTIWESNEATFSRLVDDIFISVRYSYLMPNGDIYLVIEGLTVTPYGYGLIKLDKDSNVLWTYLSQVHHSVDIAADGTVYTLEHEMDDNGHSSMWYYDGATLDDYIAVLTPDGELIRRLEILKAFEQSPYRAVITTRLMYSTGADTGDFFHTNSVKVLSEDMADEFPMAEAGDLMISIRNINGIAIINPEREEVVWFVSGIWNQQHDPHFQADGTIILFDNQYDKKAPPPLQKYAQSRIIEFDPDDMEIEWQYFGTDEQPFASWARGELQVLPNNNVLVTDSHNGRLFETTRDHEIVWEYVNPVLTGRDNKFRPNLNSGQRIAADVLTFDFNGGAP